MLDRDLAQADANAGHLAAMTGDDDRAVEALGSVITSPRTSRMAKLAAAETLARVRLGQNDVRECEAIIASIAEDAGSDPDLNRSFSVRWAAITNARLLLKDGRREAAVAVLQEEESRDDFGLDQPFAAAVSITLAQAFAARDELPAAAARLARADHLGATVFRELQGQYYFAAGSILGPLRAGLSEQLKERARRLWASQGNASLEREMAPAARRLSSQVSAPLEPSTASLVNSLASAIDLGHSPRLLADELLGALQVLGYDLDARIVETHDDPPPGDMARLVSLPLGQDRGLSLTLVTSVPDSPEVATILCDVMRIGRAAVELEGLRELEHRRSALWPESSAEERAGALFVSSEMGDILTTARRIAPTTVPVLITGETGTGKEVLARLIHAYSKRAKAPMLPFNCASVPKEMLDSQLFGHRRGAFTGASDNFSGVIRAAGGGTLFLDEIGDMSLDVQPKLLRFLESSEVHPIGEPRPVQVDVRVVAATNTDLEHLVSTGAFREDLFYRLNIVQLRLPPLRRRRTEIPMLANHYLDKYAQEFAKGDLRLAEDTMEYLLLFGWPGNIRQLANEMRRLAALAEAGAVLMPEHLSPAIAKSRRNAPVSSHEPDPSEVLVRLDQPMAAAVQHLERAMLLHALDKCHGRVALTAKMLGLSRKGLYLKRQRYGLEERREP